MPDVQGRPDRGAGVVRRRLDEEAGKRTVLKRMLIGDAIQGDAAGQAETTQSGSLVQVLDQVEYDDLGGPLQRRGNIPMVLRELLAGPSPLDPE